MIHIVVHEHALLTKATTVRQPDLNTAGVTDTAFDHLCWLSAGFNARGAPLVQMVSGVALRLDNYVGVIETPCGTILEILPKHLSGEGSELDSRRLLVKMLEAVLDVAPRIAGEADLLLLRRPLTEWVMRRFVLELGRIIKRGIRFDYSRLEEERRHLCGELDIARQLRQPPERQHWFQIRHDVYTPDRAENRLLRSATLRVRDWTTDPTTWRRANELSLQLSEIPESTRFSRDFSLWRNDRLMAHYREVRTWCELVLGAHMPIAQSGSHRGMSLLFPMERLFEKYVAGRLQRQLKAGCKMTTQAASEYLCTQDAQKIFQLEPDILVTRTDGLRWVLDTKWKLLDEKDRARKYLLSQSDFYQLHAYGHRYLDGVGKLFLIYPRTASFTTELSPFAYSTSLELHVVPFDLSTDTLCTKFANFLGRKNLSESEMSIAVI